jgi:hypothetical protein
LTEDEFIKLLPGSALSIETSIYGDKSSLKKISPEDSGEKYVDGLVSTGK